MTKRSSTARGKLKVDVLAPTEQEPSTKRLPASTTHLALVVGVSHFQEPLPRLPGATRDASALHLLLSRNTLAHYHSRLLIDPTHAQLQHALQQLVAQANALDHETTVLLYFATHGFYRDSIYQLGLAPGTSATNPSGHGALDTLPLPQLLTWLTPLQTQGLFLCLDCCRTHIENTADSALQQEHIQLPGQAWAVLTSTAPGQRAWEAEGKQGRGAHGLFTQVLLEALTTPPPSASANQEILVTSLHQHITTQLRTSAPAAQTPMLYTHFAQPISLGRYPLAWDVDTLTTGFFKALAAFKDTQPRQLSSASALQQLANIPNPSLQLLASGLRDWLDEQELPTAGLTALCEPSQKSEPIHHSSFEGYASSLEGIWTGLWCQAEKQPHPSTPSTATTPLASTQSRALLKILLQRLPHEHLAPTSSLRDDGFATIRERLRQSYEQFCEDLTRSRAWYQAQELSALPESWVYLHAPTGKLWRTWFWLWVQKEARTIEDALLIVSHEDRWLFGCAPASAARLLPPLHTHLQQLSSHVAQLYPRWQLSLAEGLCYSTTAILDTNTALLSHLTQYAELEPPSATEDI